MDRMQTEASDTTDFAVRVNDALSKDEKNVMHFDSDKALTVALKKIEAKINRNILNDEGHKMAFVIGGAAREFRELVDVQPFNSLTFNQLTVGNPCFDDPTYDLLNICPYGKNASMHSWQFFKNDATGTAAIADLVVIRGDQTNPAECVAQLFSKMIAGGRMPVENDTSKCKSKYKYNYTGNIDAVKVDGADGNAPFYLVGFKITQTAVPLVDGK